MTLIPVANPKDFPDAAAHGKIASTLAEVEAWGDRIAAENVYYYQHITKGAKGMITALVVVETTNQRKG
jgi:hypothetical protein